MHLEIEYEVDFDYRNVFLEVEIVLVLIGRAAIPGIIHVSRASGSLSSTTPKMRVPTTPESLASIIPKGIWAGNKTHLLIEELLHEIHCDAATKTENSSEGIRHRWGLAPQIGSSSFSAGYIKFFEVKSEF